MKLADMPGIMRAAEGLTELKRNLAELQRIDHHGSMFLQNFNQRAGATSENLSPDEVKDIIGILCKATKRKIEQVRIELIVAGIDPADIDEPTLPPKAVAQRRL